MSKAEILQNTPLQALGAFSEGPRTAPSRQALQVGHHSICSISAAARNAARVDCPAGIAVMLPGLQGYSARISWHCITLCVCTQIPSGPEPGAPRSGRTTCSQKGQHVFCASTTTDLIEVSLASVPCRGFIAIPEAFGGDSPDGNAEGFLLLLWMRSEWESLLIRSPFRTIHMGTFRTHMGASIEWKPTRLAMERILSYLSNGFAPLSCHSLLWEPLKGPGPSSCQGSFPFSPRRVLRTTRGAALCSNKTFVTVWDGNPIWYNYFILK